MPPTRKMVGRRKLKSETGQPVYQRDSIPILQSFNFSLFNEFPALEFWNRAGIYPRFFIEEQVFYILNQGIDIIR